MSRVHNVYVPDTEALAGLRARVVTTGGTGPQGATGATGAAGSGIELMTTKGDLLGYSTTGVRIGVGSNGQVLTADSTAAPGVAWAAPDVTSAELATAVSDHSSDTTSVHGIADTSALLDTADIGVSVASAGHNHSGTYQPLDTDLSAIAALTSAADKVPYSTGAGTWALADLTAAGRALLDDANAAAQRVTLAIPVTLSFILSDETTALTTGTKLTYEIPFALTLTEVPKASLTTAGTGTTVDIKEAGTTILTNKIVFDSGETSITTAATPPTLADSSIAANAVLTFIVDATAGAAAGLKVSLTGTRT